MRIGTPIDRPSRQQQFEEVKVRIHSKLVDKLDLTRVGDLKGDTLKREIRLVVEHLCDVEDTLLNRQERERIVEEVIDEVLGLGPLELILKDPTVSDILINGPKSIYIERAGRWKSRKWNSVTANICFRSLTELSVRLVVASMKLPRW